MRFLLVALLAAACRRPPPPPPLPDAPEAVTPEKVKQDLERTLEREHERTLEERVH